ncbi:unnamed protein product [Psylliodes chrysocephalus]|uniref:Centrosomal protein of 78 kDa n=1 Tax=Psylliodes chrysocephalus TaxID=3402493 RepID=A0A9P0CFU6_9CUCU|nr:unnamed protein product [Psylliodes chrysocephala]
MKTVSKSINCSMESSPSTKVNTNCPKPVNIFYVWYTELCRRMNFTPAPAVKPAKPKCQTILEFVGDRLRVEEWTPIVNALRHDNSLHVISIKSRLGNCEFLHNIDTEEKAKQMKRRFGSLWTAYVLHQLTKSLSSTLKNTEVLTYLELDGIPLFCEYMESLLQALKKNKTIKHLSFANSSIKDQGCNMLCRCLRFAPNIEVINLSGCDLMTESGEHLAKLIKHQQINRYCESWHNSLRYADPEQGKMRGLKRITMNANPNFGDDGFDFILNELEDDLWLKALDMQKCGITENLSKKIIDIVNYNRSLEIVDLRQNDYLTLETLEKLLQVLRDKQQMGYKPEFQWCNTAVTLTLDSISGSTFSMGTTIHKTKSAPTKNNFSGSGSNLLPMVRKSKTLDNISKSIPRNMISELNIKLQSEIQKRKSMEKVNEELKHKLEEVQSNSKLSVKSANCKKPLKVVLGASEKKPKSVNKEKTVVEAAPKLPTAPEAPKVKSGFQPAILKPLLGSGGMNGFKMKNGVKNDATTNGAGDSNGYKNGFSSRILNRACVMFENMMKTDGCAENESNDGEELLDYFINEKCVQSETESQLSSESQDSLYKYMDQLRKDEVKCTNDRT